jgi:LysR family glycine cleavage system transcriptional activator
LLLTTPPAFGSRWLIRHLPGFTAEHPGSAAAHVRVDRDHRCTGLPGRVSGTGAGSTLREDETEVFIRFGRGQYDGCRVDRLFSPRYAVVCSPRLLFSMRPLKVPADLRWHNLLHDESIMELLDRPTWAEWLHLAGVSGIDPDAGTHFSDSGTGAVGGDRWRRHCPCVAAPGTRPRWRRVRLVQPFELVIRRTQAYYLVVPEAVADRPPVQAFRRWLLREAAKVVQQ